MVEEKVRVGEETAWQEDEVLGPAQLPSKHRMETLDVSCGGRSEMVPECRWCIP